MTVPWVRPELCVVRGGGDLATGVAWRLTRAGWPVVVCELPAPLAVRRRVAVSTAVTDGVVEVEGLRAVRVADARAARVIAEDGDVAVLVSSTLPTSPPLDCDVLVDARVAKRNIDTTIDDAPLVVALGPVFTAGVDCHAVVETARGPHLGRVLWSGRAAPDTGMPGMVGGRGAERVLRAPIDGRVRWRVAIGDRVDAGEVLGEVLVEVGGEVLVEVDGGEVCAPFAGIVRGLIHETVDVTTGLKIGDVDPRLAAERARDGTPAACDEISDKALAIGGGVVDAVHTWLREVARRDD